MKYGALLISFHSFPSPRRNVTIFKGVPAFTTPARPTFCSCQSGQQPVCKPGLDVYICNAAATDGMLFLLWCGYRSVLQMLCHHSVMYV